MPKLLLIKLPKLQTYMLYFNHNFIAYTKKRVAH